MNVANEGRATGISERVWVRRRRGAKNLIIRGRKAYRFDKDWQDDETLHIVTGLLSKIQAGTKVSAPLAIQTGHKYQHQVHCRKQCICVMVRGVV